MKHGHRECWIATKNAFCAFRAIETVWECSSFTWQSYRVLGHVSPVLFADTAFGWKVLFGQWHTAWNVGERYSITHRIILFFVHFSWSGTRATALTAAKSPIDKIFFFALRERKREPITCARWSKSKRINTMRFRERCRCIDCAKNERENYVWCVAFFCSFVHWACDLTDFQWKISLQWGPRDCSKLNGVRLLWIVSGSSPTGISFTPYWPSSLPLRSGYE